MKAPRKWKMALLTWVCIYPLINIIFLTIMPMIVAWHPLLKTLLTTVILVPLMGISLQYLQKKFDNWLYR
jgi:antibiotic biosynthesis monooxygenase (ABM) superfamily enzyme